MTKVVNIHPSISIRTIETLTVTIMGMMGMFVFCTVSFLINELLKGYKKDESLKTTWLMFLLELSMTFSIFYQLQRGYLSMSHNLFFRL